MATFPLYLSIRILTQRRNAKIFPLKTLLQENDFDTELDEKIWLCFFWRKMSCNFNEFQYCLCVSSMWKFQSVMFQQIDSRTNCVFSHPGETRIEKKNWRSWEKFNYWPLSSENLTDLWFQLSRKIEKSQTRWHPSHVIQKPKMTPQTWSLRVMCSFREKHYDCWIGFFLILTENINDR